VATVVVLGESDAQAWREGKESRGRCGGGRWGSSLFYRGRGGWPVVKAEEWSTLMVMKWLTLNWCFTLWIEGGGIGNGHGMRCGAQGSASMAG
jgi:hypothetical protein